MSQINPSPPVDPIAGKAALSSIQTRLTELPAETVVPPNFDVQAAVVAALALVRFVREPEVLARFSALPKNEFDMTSIDDVELGAAALWYTQAEWLEISASTHEARLTVSLVERATTLRARMLRLLDYYFDDHPAVGVEIASIRVGTGYLDLATDLTRLAKLYATYHDVIQKDGKHYRPEDEASARETARAVLQELGDRKAGGKRDWTELRNRTWTFLVNAYTEVQAAGGFLFRGSPDVARFAPLRTLAGVVSPGRPRKKRPEEAVTEPEEPTLPDNGSAL